jgi:hypothetical protein
MRVTIYPAYSSVSGAQSVIFDAPEKCTALTIKKAAGHDATSWLYVRLNAHYVTERCDCFACHHSEWWKRPSWVRERDWAPTWARWVRTDIGARNIRLTLQGGEHFVVVALVDMPKFAAELSSRGMYGGLMALYWYEQEFNIKRAPVEKKEAVIPLEERRAAVAKIALRSIKGTTGYINECGISDWDEIEHARPLSGGRK